MKRNLDRDKLEIIITFHIGTLGEHFDLHKNNYKQKDEVIINQCT